MGDFMADDKVPSLSLDCPIKPYMTDREFERSSGIARTNIYLGGYRLMKNGKSVCPLCARTWNIRQRETLILVNVEIRYSVFRAI